MKRLLPIFLAFLTVVSARATLNGDGYYRVNNYASARYIYVEDNRGSLDMTGMTADLAAIELYMEKDRRLSDPSTIIYVQKQSSGQYDFQGQGTGVHAIIDHYVSVLEYPSGSGNYLFYATQSGLAKYLADSQKDLTMDKGRMTSEGSGDWRKWQMTPVSSSTSEYFGVLPEVKVGNDYYATFYAAFPFSFASSGMEAYTINVVDNGMAVLKKVSGVVPASTPVLIKCAGSTPAANKLNLGGSASSVSGNKLKGIYFNNATMSHKNQTKYDANTMRVLGVTSDGKLGFVTGTETYLAKNRAYLSVASGSPAQLKIVTEDEYNSSFVTVKVESADANQGTVYVNTSGTTSVKVAKGTNVTLNATPKSPYLFSNWTLNGSQVSTSASYTVAANADATYRANFKLPAYAVTLSATNGSLTATAAGAALVSGQSYNHGTEITVTKATPNDGYEFATLKVGDKDVTSDFKANGKYTFTLTAATTIAATFTVIPEYVLTVEAPDGNVTVTAAGQTAVSGKSYRRGTAMSVTAVEANDGYEFAGLKVNSNDVTSSFVKNGKYDFTLNEATTVKAEFTKIPEYTVSLTARHGSVVVVDANGNTVADGQQVRRDSELVIKNLTVDEGWRIIGLTLNDVEIYSAFNNSPDGYAFTVTDDVEIEVEYVEITPDPEPRVYMSVEGQGKMVVSLKNDAHPALVPALSSGDPIPYSPEGTTIYVYLTPSNKMMVSDLIINGNNLSTLESMSLVTETSYGMQVKYTVTEEDANINVRFVDDPSGIDYVAAPANDAEVEYYDLNGVRVNPDNLSHGIYIRRQGQEVTKIIL